MEKYDVIVAGGGLTGVAAATAAARRGAKVLLIERSGGLGGAMTNNLVYPFMAFWTRDPKTGEKRYLSAGLFTEMRDRYKAMTGDTSCDYGVKYKTDYYKCVLDDTLEDSGADVLYHATVHGVVTKDRRVNGICVATRGGDICINADYFIDATGDGELFALAGCDYQLGRESDGLCQPMTTCFRLANVNMPEFEQQRGDIQKLYKQFREQGKIKNPREDVLVFTGIGGGIVHFNSTRVVKHNPTDPIDLSRAEILARRQMLELYNFLKDNFSAFKDSFIITSANEIGIRESRKLKGMHILSGEEIINCVKFEDSIAVGNYDIDIHNPEGSGTSHHNFSAGEYYTIPYRSLLPKEYDNMLVAGRCISADHRAQASLRIMPICCTLGEAAGTAAAVAFKSGTNTHTVDVKEIQNELKKAGAVID